MLAERFSFGLRCWVIGLGVLLSGSTAGARKDVVVVSATAAPDYVRTLPDGTLRPEGYVVMPGIQFGMTKDTSLAAAGLSGVLQALAPVLAQREYWPVKDPAQADLLLVVHWGETEVFEDPLADFTGSELDAAVREYSAGYAANQTGDPGEMNRLQSQMDMAAGDRQMTSQRNAALLGYQRTLEREEERFFASEEERTMKTELGEQRYLVVVMAYDLPRLRAKKGSRLLWVTRMSVRSIGHNFGAALPAMVRTAAPVLGTQQSELVRVRLGIETGKTEVNIGDAIVVGNEPESASPAPASPPAPTASPAPAP